MSVLNKKITLRSVVMKIRNKSLQEYDGNIHDHAIELFSNLSNEEKIVFIEDIVNLFSIAEFRNQHENSTAKYTNRKNGYKFNERRENFELDIKESLEYKNASSLIDMKNFVTKSIVISILAFIFIAGICLVYIEKGISLPDSLDFIRHFYLLLKTP